MLGLKLNPIQNRGVQIPPPLPPPPPFPYAFLKIGSVENVIPDVIKLVKKADYDNKISEIEKKSFTTSNYNKFRIEILNPKIK